VPLGDATAWDRRKPGETCVLDPQPPANCAAPAPYPLPALSPNSTKIVTGGYHSAIIRNGTMWGWGYNSGGQAGRVTVTNQMPALSYSEPAIVGGIIADICMTKYATCVVLTDGSVNCFGSAQYGVLGRASGNDIGDTETPASAGPLQLSGRAVSVACGEHVVCALLEDAAVQCWVRSVVRAAMMRIGLVPAAFLWLRR
jgi:alpha-tubulin suppressor-like RCC1 family protein